MGIVYMFWVCYICVIKLLRSFNMKKGNKNYEKYLMGVVDGENIYLSPPSWDCDWYWGFGYLGNDNCHYHVSGLMKEVNLRDGLVEHFGSSLTIRPSDLWTFSELFVSFYALRNTAEVLGRGGSHLSNNPCKDVIINQDEVIRINGVVLPSIFEAIYEILERNRDNKALFSRLVEVDGLGDTEVTVDFMLDNSIHTDDLVGVEGLFKEDVSRIHKVYWKRFHGLG